MYFFTFTPVFFTLLITLFSTKTQPFIHLSIHFFILNYKLALNAPQHLHDPPLHLSLNPRIHRQINWHFQHPLPRSLRSGQRKIHRTRHNLRRLFWLDFKFPRCCHRHRPLNRWFQLPSKGRRRAQARWCLPCFSIRDSNQHQDTRTVEHPSSNQANHSHWNHREVQTHEHKRNPRPEHFFVRQRPQHVHVIGRA